LRLRLATVLTRLGKAHVNALGCVVEDLDCQPVHFICSLNDGVVFVQLFCREPVLANVFFAFSFFGRNAEGSEVTSNFSTTNWATFSVGYAALSPATANEEHDNTAATNMSFIFRFPFWLSRGSK
jgi:hypothetical protein